MLLDVRDQTDITDALQELLQENTEIIIPEGLFYISNTIRIPSNCAITGSGSLATELMLADKTNNNMFTNNDYRGGNESISIANIRFDGNLEHQFKPASEKRLSFCNIFYLANAKDVSFRGIYAKNCFQTVLHFNKSRNVTIENMRAENLGWSGISSSGTDSIVARDLYIYNSGNDHRHSAIHLDGGNGAYIQGSIVKCVGNGIMLDSKYSPFNNAVVEAECSGCLRGIALIGNEEFLLRNILVRESRVFDNDIGVMVSNASHAFVDSVVMENNRDVGILLQGRSGATDTVVANCSFHGNGADIRQIHGSKDNYFVNNNFSTQREN